MTLEEAVEVVLVGKAWIRCTACGGEGYIPGFVTGERHVCGICMKDGSIRNLDYIEACGLIKPNEPYPQRPFTRRERIAQLGAEIIKNALGTSTTDRVKRLFNIKEAK